MKENETAVAIRYNKDFTVVQANELVRSKQDELTLLESRLIRLAISQVLQDDTDLKTYSCEVGDLAKYLGISAQNIYRDIQSLSNSLMKKSIFIKDTSNPQTKGRENYKIFHWIDHVEYIDGTVTFKLSDSLKPYLLGLNELFTIYGYRAVIALPTSNSIRLYELIASYEKMTTLPHYNESNYTDIEIGKNELIFTIDWLRDYFNCQDKYPNTGDFVRRVVERSVKAVRDNTLMNLSYRTIKEGRNITHVVFKLADWLEDDPQEFMRRLREERDKF